MFTKYTNRTRMNMSYIETKRPILAGVATALALTGCMSSLYKPTGAVVSGITQAHTIPTVLSDDDVAMACEIGVSFHRFVTSLGRVSEPPNRVSLITSVAAGMCAERDAWEAELRQLRGLYKGDPGEASDARALERQHHATAAKRYHEAWREMSIAFRYRADRCPSVSRKDEHFFLLGLSAGLLAVMHDRAAGGVVGVPTNMPHKVARAAQCLNDERWWGVPKALEAAVWVTIPGAVPEDVDPYAQLTQSARRGERAGVRLARALQAVALSGAGRDGDVRATIEGHAAALKSRESARKWRLLDKFATLLILHESDKIWTRETGHRTPYAQLGSFPEFQLDPQKEQYYLEGLDFEPDSTNREQTATPLASKE